MVSDVFEIPKSEIQKKKILNFGEIGGGPRVVQLKSEKLQGFVANIHYFLGLFHPSSHNVTNREPPESLPKPISTHQTLVGPSKTHWGPPVLTRSRMVPSGFFRG